MVALFKLRVGLGIDAKAPTVLLHLLVLVLVARHELAADDHFDVLLVVAVARVSLMLLHVHVLLVAAASRLVFPSFVLT